MDGFKTRLREFATYRSWRCSLFSSLTVTILSIRSDTDLACRRLVEVATAGASLIVSERGEGVLLRGMEIYS